MGAIAYLLTSIIQYRTASQTGHLLATIVWTCVRNTNDART